MNTLIAIKAKEDAYINQPVGGSDGSNYIAGARIHENDECRIGSDGKLYPIRSEDV